MAGTEGLGGIPTDRVVAVFADLGNELLQTGSGYLVTEHSVLTARHCTVDKRTGQPALSLRVARLSDGAKTTATLIAARSDSDVAVLAVGKDPAWPVPITSEPPRFGRVDRSRAVELSDCRAVGFPLWQLDSKDQQNAADLRGPIRAIEDAESGLLVMRDPLLKDVAVPATAATQDQAEESAWDGLSGALVFYQGLALGIVVRHHPWKGSSAITILPVERFAAGPAGGDLDSAAVAAALGLPAADQLPQPGDSRWPILSSCRWFMVSCRGWPSSTRTRSARPRQRTGTLRPTGSATSMCPAAKDEPLAAALLPGRLVVLVGPSKAGKTRTAFEVLRGHQRLGRRAAGCPGAGVAGRAGRASRARRLRPAGDLAG